MSVQLSFTHKLLALSVAGVFALTGCNQNTPAEGTSIGADGKPAETAPATTATATSDGQTTAPSTGEFAELKITGVGASFPQPIYAKWSADFNSATGGQVNYQSIGSSGGIKQIKEKTVDFGASDAPLTVDELNADGLIQFPTVIGGVVPVINVDGVSAGQLKLDGDTLAKIYLGKITKWNDPAITALNEGVTLPDANITTVFRSDGSGTTFNFTDYLTKVSPDWASAVGVDKAVKWPTSATGMGGKGNDGVASYVGRVKNSIGYVEYAFAKQNNMAHVSLKNAKGEFVQPSADSFAAAGDIDWSAEAGFNKVLTNSDTAGAWPIAAATFIIIRKNPQNPEQVKGVLEFFNWAYANGDDSAKALDYVPFSDTAVGLFKASWAQIRGADGQPLFNK
ncbi:phosphate ABC transporter substrate-binding protein PstS [Moraxella bovis]|uniref:phosphate ABC transporter substrate-binding protein PstS n=1 Tax=Moraxella bovis TaxID=476 RepID=UPI0022270E31|nr:phosphate ABC transporter substrate-binding protein PstS [Moraxella bovis]UZA37745.1 phosphate ABC transporter substrate-binding protein PstS [Moraxella bovis]